MIDFSRKEIEMLQNVCNAFKVFFVSEKDSNVAYTLERKGYLTVKKNQSIIFCFGTQKGFSKAQELFRKY
jgi:hypothetical protein